MQILVKTPSEELRRSQIWWNGLEMQWKMAFNEAQMGKGPVLEPPTDDQLVLMLTRADTFRFAGPGALNPNMTTSLTNLSGLIPLFHINYLSVSNSRITSLEELKNHKNIEHLFVYENKLTSLKGIEGMKNLKSLYAQDNYIDDISPVEHLTQLETFYILKNNIKSLSVGITEKHADNMKAFYVLPNRNIKDRDVIKFQNTVGIICRKG